MKKYVLIVNPKAGMNRHRLGAADVIPSFEDEDVEIIEKTTLRGGHAVEIAREWAGKCDAIICCGGDGTYNEVVNGIVKSGSETKTPVIYLPCGSTNDFANTLKLPMTPPEAAKLLRRGSTHDIDVGSIDDTQFTYVASFGIGTPLSYSTSQKAKNIIGYPAYIINGFVLHFFPIITSLKPTHMKIETDDGRVFEGNYYLGFISNTLKVSGMFNFDTLGVKLDDGLFEVMLVENINAANIVPLFLKVLKKDFDHDNLTMFKASGLKITSDEPVKWSIDGERYDSDKNCEIKVLHKAIRLVSGESELLG